MQDISSAWKITSLDYEAPLFANAEAREGAGVAQMLWAKWLQRGLAAPSRTVKSGRAGQYSAKKIFELRVMNVVTQQMAIPVGEAQQIAALAADGPWSIKELAEDATHWKSLVIREPPPQDVFLSFSRSRDCWGYEPATIGPPTINELKNSATLVLAAARELTAVSKYCWNILHGPGRGR